MYLATTALTEFWKVDEPILFLGEWCLKYSERHVWEPLIYQVLEYPWNDHERLSDAITYCDGVYESLLETLTEYMNNVHGVNYGKRYWRIILGPAS
jgi:putative transferase (TIGR04331 family)